MPGGMLRYGIPEYRLPKERILAAEYEAVWDLGAKLVTGAELGIDFTIDDLQNQGFDAVLVAIGCYDTNKLGIPGEDADGVIDGLEYLRIATLGLPYPDHKGKRVVVVGGGFTSMDCSRTSVRQGCTEVTLVYRRDMKDMPAADEVHEMLEEGARAIFQASPTRVVTDKANKVTGVEFQRMALGEPDASGRRRPQPVEGTEFIIDCDRVLLAIGQGPELDWLENGAEGIEKTKRWRLDADAVTFGTGRTGVFGAGDVRTGAATVVEAIAEGRRASYAIDAYLQGQDLDEIRTRQTLAEPQPEFLSIVPYTSEVKEPRIRLKAMPAEERNDSYIEYEIPYTAEEAMSESARCLQCTCEAIGYCDLRRQGIEYGTTLQTLEPKRTGLSVRSVSENRFTGTNHDYIRDDSHAFILREPSRCIDCGRCVERLPRGRGCGLLRLHAHRLRHARDHAAGHEPQHHALRLLRPLCRDLPHGRAHAQAARAREVRGGRVSLHPLRHLRRRLPLRRAPLRAGLRARARVARGAADRPHRPGGDGSRLRDELCPPRTRLAQPSPG